MTWGASGGVSGASFFQERKHMSAREFLEGHFGATWSILGAILDPLDFEGGPKILHFNYPARHLYKECFVAKSIFEKKKT